MKTKGGITAERDDHGEPSEVKPTTIAGGDYLLWNMAQRIK
jgi:hypothetical protein